jgi:lipoprotein-anchoring transpeptidase ErfK/SrfK
MINDEKIGQRISKGCICMKNNDVIELYDVVPLGSLVMISDN